MSKIQFVCKDENSSEQAQKMAFSQGYRWPGSDAIKVQHTDKPVLVFTRAGKIVRGNKEMSKRTAYTCSPIVLYEWFEREKEPEPPKVERAGSYVVTRSSITPNETATTAEETEMSKTIKFEVRAFINGVTAAELSDDEVFTVIADAEGELKRLQSIAEANRPVKLSQKIDDIIEFISR